MIVIMGSSYKTNTHQKQETEMPTPQLLLFQINRSIDWSAINIKRQFPSPTGAHLLL
jgi:hypothetical protein